MRTLPSILAFAAIIGQTACGEPTGAPDQPPKASLSVRFMSYDGDALKAGAAMTFQINGSRTEFLKLGERIFGSRLKLLKFTHKTRRNEKLQEDEDVSELTLVNVETGKSVLLVLSAKATDVSEIK